MIVVMVMMWIFNGNDFMSFNNFQSMGYQLPELGVLSLAMMITMLTAGINLSIVASANLSGIVMAFILTGMVSQEGVVQDSSGVVVLAILAGLLVGILIGFLNGFLIAVVGISPILATLGTSIMIGGISVVITKGYVISGFPKAILTIGNGSFLGIPIPLLVFLICAGVMTVILEKTPLGTRVYLMGSNPIACLYSGVDNKKVIFQTYIISGILSSVAAIIMIARFNSAKADYGESYVLQAVLASVLGGVNASGGFGKVSGLIISIIILQMISSGLNLMGVSNFLTIAIWGIILLLVMVVKFLLEKNSQKRKFS
ncbi:MAG TPA: sugar ABC transporter permease [Anaerolineaceae bacterium]|nr:sugar ABC transporter permease [Anaerolineaceae bacterium]